MATSSYQVKRGTDVGTLKLDADQLCFTPKNGEKESTTIPWEQVSKHQSNPPKNAKAMIKIVPHEGAPVTFQLKNRTVLDGLQDDITKRMQSLEADEEEEEESENSAVDATTATVYSQVTYLSTTGSVTLTNDKIIYQPEDNKGKILRIGWAKVTKHQASPPKIAKAMLKLILSTGKNHTFQFHDRDELKRFQDDVTQRIKAYHQEDDASSSEDAEDCQEEPPSAGPPPIPKRIHSEDSEEAEEEEEDEVDDDEAQQTKGETSKEHNSVQEASESPTSEQAVEKDDSSQEGNDDEEEKEDGKTSESDKDDAFSGTLGGLIAMGGDGNPADGDVSGSDSERSAEDNIEAVMDSTMDDSVEEFSTEETEQVEEEAEQSAPDDDLFVEDEALDIDDDREGEDIDFPQDDMEFDEDNFEPATSLDEDELDDDEHVLGDDNNIFNGSGSSGGDMDDSIDSLKEHDDNSQGSQESFDEPIEEQEAEVPEEDIDMDAFAEAAVDYEEESESEVHSDEEEGEMVLEDAVGDVDDENSMEGSSENFDIVDEVPPETLNTLEDLVEEGEEELEEADDIDGEEELYDEEEEEEEDYEEEQMSSLLVVGGLGDDDEDLGEEDDFDVLAGKAIRAEGDYSDEEEDYDEPQIRLRRHDEYDEDDTPAGAGSDEEDTPFFDDDNEDSFADFGGGVLEGGSLPMALRSGPKKGGDGSMADSVSSEETLSLSGLTGVASLSSNVSNESSEEEDSEEDERSHSDSSSASSSSKSEDDDIYSDEEDYSASDSSDTASFVDEEEYSDSASEESSEASESESEYSDDEDYDSEEEEEEEIQDYQDPASAWLAFSENQDEQAFPEVEVPVLKKKNKKNKKKRQEDSDSEGREKEFSSDEEEDYSEEDYSEDDDIDEDDYSDGSEEDEGSEHSMELELDIEDLTVDDLETALVSKLSAEIGDSADAQKAVHQMLSSLREDLMQGKDTTGKSKREHPGMPEDFYDWAKKKATRVLRSESARNLGLIPPKKEARPPTTLEPVLEKELFFDWKKFAKENKDGVSKDTPPSSSDSPPEDSKEEAPAGDEAEVAEGAGSKSVSSGKKVDYSLPLEPYDDALVEKWTLRPKPEDPDVRLFNWKGFTKARRPIVGPPLEGSTAEGPGFDWKKYAKKQRKLANKKAKEGGNSGAPGDEEKKSDEEQGTDDVITTGVDLLKRLISTKDESKRTEILSQYLAPPASPDETDGHVSPNDLLEAIAKFVEMIRTAKQSDNAPEITSARQVAILARLAIVEHYGEGSDTLSNFEQGLAPAFAPKFESG